VYRQVGAQHEGEGPRYVGVLSLGLVKDTDALDDFSVFVGQERPIRSQSGAEGAPTRGASVLTVTNLPKFTASSS